MKKSKDEELLIKAGKAIRGAVKKVIAERKLRGEPLIVWQDGKVVRIPASKLRR